MSIYDRYTTIATAVQPFTTAIYDGSTETRSYACQPHDGVNLKQVTLSSEVESLPNTATKLPVHAISGQKKYPVSHPLADHL